MERLPRFKRRDFLTAAGASGALVLAAGPALGQQVFKEIHALEPGEFTWHPEQIWTTISAKWPGPKSGTALNNFRTKAASVRI